MARLHSRLFALSLLGVGWAIAWAPHEGPERALAAGLRRRRGARIVARSGARTARIVRARGRSRPGCGGGRTDLSHDRFGAVDAGVAFFLFHVRQTIARRTREGPKRALAAGNFAFGDARRHLLHTVRTSGSAAVAACRSAGAGGRGAWGRSLSRGLNRSRGLNAADIGIGVDRTAVGPRLTRFELGIGEAIAGIAHVRPQHALAATCGGGRTIGGKYENPSGNSQHYSHRTIPFIGSSRIARTRARPTIYTGAAPEAQRGSRFLQFDRRKLRVVPARRGSQ